MKNQILTIFVIIFSIITATGQNSPSDQPVCTATPLSPAAGQNYNYAVAIGNSGGFTGNGFYKWYITQDANLLDNSKIKLNNSGEFIASGAVAYNLSRQGQAANNIDIIWTSAALASANPYYLVVQYQEDNGSCDAKNMKVYRIVPQNAFWLKIDNVADADGGTGGAIICAANPTGATINETTGEAEYKFGQNILYVKVTANGYEGDWDPILKISGLVDDQSIAANSITWKSGSKTGAFSLIQGETEKYKSDKLMPSISNIDGDGAEIIISIPIENNHHEGLTDQAISIAIDGSYSSGTTTFKDKSIMNGNCTDAADFEDVVEKTIKARPEIQSATPNSFANAPTLKP